MNSRRYRDYWDENIDKWGEFYLDISHGHEILPGPRWFTGMYHATIGRLERRLMAQRYARTIEFLDAHIRPGIVLSDVGCGTGIFVVEALRRGAVVNAIDFTDMAIEMTRANVAKHCPTGAVRYYQLDVQQQPLPKSDVTLAMGLTPYLTDLPAFFSHTLSNTGMLFCLFVNPRHWANRLRARLPMLNVRGLQCYAVEDVDRLYAQHRWHLIERRRFATGYIDRAERLPL